MALDIGTFRVNVDTEVNGFWHEVSGAKLCIARVGNPVYKRLVRERLADHIRKRLTEEQIDQILGTILGECILIGWENLQENGKELPYSKGDAVRLMTSQEYHDFRDIVVFLAEKEEFYRADYVERTKKKSQSGSDGDAPSPTKQ